MEETSHQSQFIRKENKVAQRDFSLLILIRIGFLSLILFLVVSLWYFLVTPSNITRVTIKLEGVKSSCPAWVALRGSDGTKEMTFAAFYSFLKHKPDLCTKLSGLVGREVTLSFRKKTVETIDGKISVNEVTGLWFVLPEPPVETAPQKHVPATAASASRGRSGFYFVK